MNTYETESVTGGTCIWQLTPTGKNAIAMFTDAGNPRHALHAELACDALNRHEAKSASFNPAESN